ncbi:MAG: hypothetical protein M1820_000898 [Bogoriella megaspora]|nr:MAG: hypothetical protein M1820_000898 [Bogoriella megaspora]
MSAKLSSVDIPVVDISEDKHAAKALVDAASRHGFVFVQDSEAYITKKQKNHMFNLSRSFFSSPVSVKETCSINSNKSGKNKGWLSMGTETLDPGHQKRGDLKEAFNLGEFADGKAQQPLPKTMIPHEEDIHQFTVSCHRLCNRILRLFASGLEISNQDWFSERHDQTKGPSGTAYWMMTEQYPSVPDNGQDLSEDIRAGAHSDYGSITLLFQLRGQPGLEILTPENKWSSVPVNPRNEENLPILVNIGDLLSYWTHGLLKSTVHRVIFPKDGKIGGEDRYSIAYFCHPQDDAALLPVPSPLIEQHRSSKDSVVAENIMTAKDHLDNRLAATYGLKKAS